MESSSSSESLTLPRDRGGRNLFSVDFTDSRGNRSEAYFYSSDHASARADMAIISSSFLPNTIAEFVGEIPPMSNEDARRRITAAGGVVTNEPVFNEEFPKEMK